HSSLHTPPFSSLPPATPHTYPLSLHAALPISERLPLLRAAHADSVAEVEKSRQANQPLPADLQFLATDRCPSCDAAVSRNDTYCNGCGLKVQSPAVDRHRWLRFYQRQLGEHEQAGRLALYEAHTLRTDAKARLKAANVRMEHERAATVTAVEPAAPRKPFLEILLDPKNTQ